MHFFALTCCTVYGRAMPRLTVSEYNFPNPPRKVSDATRKNFRIQVSESNWKSFRTKPGKFPNPTGKSFRIHPEKFPHPPGKNFRIQVSEYDGLVTKPKLPEYTSSGIQPKVSESKRKVSESTRSEHNGDHPSTSRE